MRAIGNLHSLNIQVRPFVAKRAMEPHHILVSSTTSRRYRAHYASSVAAEIKQNVALAEGEKIVYSQFIRERANWMMGKPRLLAITWLRLVLLEHNIFSADWIIEIPRSAVLDASRDVSSMRRWVSLRYLDDKAQTRSIWLQPMERHMTDDDVEGLHAILNAFREGQPISPA
jgi:hypothetical protein